MGLLIGIALFILVLKIIWGLAIPTIKSSWSLSGGMVRDVSVVPDDVLLGSVVNINVSRAILLGKTI